MKKIALISIIFLIILSAIIWGLLNNKTQKEQSRNDSYNSQELVSSDKEILREKIVLEESTNDSSAPLNITILLDLSDRIAPITNDKETRIDKGFIPMARDFEAIDTIINLFKTDAMKGNKSGAKKLIDLKSKIKLVCIPKPKDNKISFDRLNIDFSDRKYNGTNSNLIHKNDVFNNLSNLTKKYKNENNQEETSELVKIYENILSTKSFPGSDIWKFFEQYAKSYCINKNYRNILIIFTDGYIYHEDSIYQEKNRYSYLTSKLLTKYGLRDPNLTVDKIKNKIQKEDFGLITRASNLQDLEVLVVEVLPNKKWKFDGYVIEEVLKKWFNEMGIKHSEILFSNEDSDLTASRIRDFFDYSVEK